MVIVITNIFLPIIDSETEDWRHLPFHGSIMNQPYMTMQILKLLQLNFRKHLSEKAESIRIKAKRWPQLPSLTHINKRSNLFCWFLSKNY